MKKVLVASIVVALVALSAPLWAQTAGYTPPGNGGTLDSHCDVSLDGQVTFKKDVTITQDRTDRYTTALTTNKTFDPKARADAEAVKNDLNYNNCMEVGASIFTDNMNGSFVGFIGIGQSNQAAGQMNNQGNVAAVAFVSNNDAYSSALTAVGVSNKNNEFYGNKQKDGSDWFGGRDSAVLTQTDNMLNSFNTFIGIGQSNQSAGSMNNQNNAVAVAAGVQEDPGSPKGWGGDFKGGGSMVAMAASELAMTNSCNKFQIDKATFTNNMVGSFNGFVGIGQSNQSAGNMNNQANVVSVAATVSLH